MFDAAIASAQPAHCLPPFLPKAQQERPLTIFGAGKASAAMAQAVEQHYPGPLRGLVVTRYGYGVPCEHIEIVEAAHPVPDAAGRAVAARMLKWAASLTEQDTVLGLISGGGSALLSQALAGITLADKQAVNQALLSCGATIREINCVRRHISGIKGGRLAAACHPAKVINLLISDVPGDNPLDIASGPTVADPTTCEDALAIVRRYELALPSSVRAVLESGAGESIPPTDERLARVETHLIATPQLALEAAAQVGRQAGYAVHLLSDCLEGESREVGIAMAGIVRQIVQRDQPFPRPCVLLSGGETTVTVRGEGSGGPNVEFLLSLAVALDGLEGVYALAGDTDGVDGAAEVAGAVISPTTLARAQAKGIAPRERLAHNDGHGFFAELGDQVLTGPTRTNVNDFRAIVIV
jgi:hydroxypyruvate reductase